MRTIIDRAIRKIRESPLLDSELASNFRMRLSPSASKGLLARFDRSIYMRHQVKRFKSKEVLPQEFVEAVFKIYYGDLDPNSIVPTGEVKSAVSFVPYRRGLTNVLIYNFFKANYGIRDPVLFRLSIVSEGEVYWTHQFLLKGDEIRKISDPCSEGHEEGLPEYGAAVIEAFHPRIKTLASQFRFFGFYENRTAGTLAGVHSANIPMRKVTRLQPASHRSFSAAAEVETDYNSLLHSALPMDSVSSTDHGKLSKMRIGCDAPSMETQLLSGIKSCQTSFGYITIHPPGQRDRLGAIWHEGPNSHVVREAEPKRKICACVQAFFVPDFSANAPLVLATKDQIGFRPDRLTFKVETEQGDVVAERTVDFDDDEDEKCLDLAQVFQNDGIAGPVNVIVDFHEDAGSFTSYPACYLHILYRSEDGYSDQCHTHRTSGYWNDPFRSERSYRCRKFAPLLKSEVLSFIYSIINVGGNGPNKDDSVRVRVITDQGSEVVLGFPVATDGVTNLRGDDILDRLDSRIDKFAIVQFEHETTNYNGNWLAINKKTKHIAVDHFTGG